MIWSLFLCVLVCKTLKKKWMRVRKCVYFKKRVSDRGVVGLINVPFPFLPTMVGQEKFLEWGSLENGEAVDVKDHVVNTNQ